MQPPLPVTQTQSAPAPVPPPSDTSVPKQTINSLGEHVEDVSEADLMDQPSQQELDHIDSMLYTNVVENVNNNLINDVVNADVKPDLDLLSGDGVDIDNHGNADIVLLHPENVKIPKLTNGQRITLAYDYLQIPARENNNDRDEDEVQDGEVDRLHTSFPKAEIISKMFAGYVANFEKGSSKSLSAGASGSLPASNVYTIKPGFQCNPQMESWAFKSHGQDFPQGVDFDGNIGDIKAKPNDPLPKSILLKSEELGNIQKAASYQLRAVSHLEWYRKSVKNSVDMVLQQLDPVNQQGLIKVLQDSKQFLKGISYATNQVTKMAVYQHAGITSSLRCDFLQRVGNSMPLEEKAVLFSLPYGTSLVFEGEVSRVASKVKEHRADQNAARTLATSLRIADQMLKPTRPVQAVQQSQSNRGRRPGGQGGVTTRAQFQGNQKFNNASTKFPNKQQQGGNQSGQSGNQQQHSKGNNQGSSNNNNNNKSGGQFKKKN